MSQRENNDLNQPGDPEQVEKRAPGQRSPDEQDKADLEFDASCIKNKIPLDEEARAYRAVRSDEAARRHRRNEWSTTARGIAERVGMAAVALGAFVASRALDLTLEEALAATGVAVGAASTVPAARAIARRFGRRR